MRGPSTNCAYAPSVRFAHAQCLPFAQCRYIPSLTILCSPQRQYNYTYSIGAKFIATLMFIFCRICFVFHRPVFLLSFSLQRPPLSPMTNLCSFCRHGFLQSCLCISPVISPNQVQRVNITSQLQAQLIYTTWWYEYGHVGLEVSVDFLFVWLVFVIVFKMVG